MNPRGVLSMCLVGGIALGCATQKAPSANVTKGRPAEQVKARPAENAIAPRVFVPWAEPLSAAVARVGSSCVGEETCRAFIDSLPREPVGPRFGDEQAECQANVLLVGARAARSSNFPATNVEVFRAIFEQLDLTTLRSSLYPRIFGTEQRFLRELSFERFQMDEDALILDQ